MKHARVSLKKDAAAINELQDMLYAQRDRALLVVLQGMDTSGKSGVIRNVFADTSPLGMQVEAFKAPSKTELAHDYLWRIHREVPRKGEVVVFNRSHYEDILAVRVRELQPRAVWRKRFDHINDFERMLSDEGTLILKFFLHLSKDEQRERLQARLDEPHKNWKFSAGDLKDRARWDDYMVAYEDALNATSRAHAPWYAIPADSKPFMRLTVAKIIRDQLAALNLEFPRLPDDEKAELAVHRAALASEIGDSA